MRFCCMQEKLNKKEACVLRLIRMFLNEFLMLTSRYNAQEERGEQKPFD